MNDLPLPPCPCPICGQVHPHFISGSSHSLRGAGRGLLSAPHSQYRIHMTPEELDSAIYGPLTQSLVGSKCPCRVVSIHDAERMHGFAPSDIEHVRAGATAVVPAQIAGFGETKNRVIPLVSLLIIFALIRFLFR